MRGPALFGEVQGIGAARVSAPGSGHRHVPIVLRVYDRTLGAAVAHRFGFENVRSTVDLAAPWFIGAALGLQVVGTFSVGQRSFMVGACTSSWAVSSTACEWPTSRLRWRCSWAPRSWASTPGCEEEQRRC